MGRESSRPDLVDHKALDERHLHGRSLNTCGQMNQKNGALCAGCLKPTTVRKVTGPTLRLRTSSILTRRKSKEQTRTLSIKTPGLVRDCSLIIESSGGAFAELHRCPTTSYVTSCGPLGRGTLAALGIQPIGKNTSESLTPTATRTSGNTSIRGAAALYAITRM